MTTVNNERSTMAPMHNEDPHQQFSLKRRQGEFKEMYLLISINGMLYTDQFWSYRIKIFFESSTPWDI